MSEVQTEEELRIALAAAEATIADMARRVAALEKLMAKALEPIEVHIGVGDGYDRKAIAEAIRKALEGKR